MIIIIIILIIILSILFFNKIKCENYSNNKSIKLSIQTVFLLKENIPFLREWIIYNLNLGFDKIYLYDNTGSVGRNGSNKNTNKYNMNFDKLINISDEEINIELKKIIDEFPNNIIYVKWQPKNEKGEIIYGPILSVNHYLDNYGNDSDYTAFIDIDEFIFSKNNLNLKEYIINNNKDKYILLQKKFIDRFCYLNKNVIEIEDSYNLNTSAWGYKTIIKNNKISINEKSENIHLLKITTKNVLYIPMDDFRFNHYNVNKKQLEYMKKFYKQDNFEITKDNSIIKYKEIIDNKCNNNCSDKNKYINENYFNENLNNCIM
jgi:hypothetical protein